jgi:hypothetical protein
LEFQFPVEQNSLHEKSEEIKSSTVSGITFSTLITTTASTTTTTTAATLKDASTITAPSTTATTSTTTTTNSKQTTTTTTKYSDGDDYPFKIKDSENEFLTADESRIFFEAFSRTTPTMPKTSSSSNPSQMSNRVLASSRQNGNDISPNVITKTTVIKDISPNVNIKTTVNDNSPNVITKTTSVVIDNSENGHFAFEDICSDDMLAVCATVGIVVVCLCTSGLYAVFYTAYQVNEMMT